MQTDAIAGAILGCAVGDAIGLPYAGAERIVCERGDVSCSEANAATVLTMNFKNTD